LLLDSASTVIPGFSLLEIHDQDFYSLLDLYAFRSGASSSMKEGSVFLRRRYVCCTVVSARVYPRCSGIQVFIDFQSYSQLLYDWWFTANQFTLAPSPLRIIPSRATA
jgi:hypothetical protein